MGMKTDATKGYIYLVIACLAIFALIGGMMYLGLLAKPAFLKLERTAYKESYQYSEAKEDQLLKYINEYEDLESQKQQYIAVNGQGNYTTVIDQLESQQKIIKDSIYEAADMVSDWDRLPRTVQTFMNEHPRGR